MRTDRFLVLALGLLAGCARVPSIEPQALDATEQCAEKLDQGDLDGAEVLCDQALQASPRYANAWLQKGIILMRRGQREDAQESFTRAVHFDPRLPQAHNMLGIIAYQDRRYGEAEGYFRRALQLKSDYVATVYNLALSYAASRQPERAKRELRGLIKARPRLADPYHFLGVLLLEQGAREEALAQLRQALQLVPRNTNYWLATGIAYYRLLRYDDAEYAFASCLEIDPKEERCRRDLELTRSRSELLPPIPDGPKE